MEGVSQNLSSTFRDRLRALKRLKEKEKERSASPTSADGSGDRALLQVQRSWIRGKTAGGKEAEGATQGKPAKEKPGYLHAYLTAQYYGGVIAGMEKDEATPASSSI
jgi:hypothetical protein